VTVFRDPHIVVSDQLIRREPQEVIDEAHETMGPFIHRVCLCSGGGDSMVVAHRCRDQFDTLVYIDTGVALPGAADHVRRFADKLGKPLLVYTTPPEVYDELIVKLKGFPGPAQHNRCYNRLKERRLREMLRDLKHGEHRHSRVLAISGIRRAESQRRKNRQPVTRSGSLVFCNPLIDWTNEEMRAYRREHGLELSDVAALCHRSGECMCAAMAPPGEREFIRDVFPEWFEQRIAPLERMCEENGWKPDRWGPGRVTREQAEAIEAAGDVGPLCTDCQLQIEGMEVVS